MWKNAIKYLAIYSNKSQAWYLQQIFIIQSKCENVNTDNIYCDKETKSNMSWLGKTGLELRSLNMSAECRKYVWVYIRDGVCFHSVIVKNQSLEQRKHIRHAGELFRAAVDRPHSAPCPIGGE